MYDKFSKCFGKGALCKDKELFDEREISEEPDADDAPALSDMSDFLDKYGSLFEQLAPEWQDFLYQRDMKLLELFRKKEQEIEAKKFLDEAFIQKGQRHGFKNARDWIEKLILAEELLEDNPKGTLEFLAKSYGVDLSVLPASGSSDNAHLNELKLAYLTDELQHLQEKVERRERREAALRANAAAAKRAKEAAFAPQGKKPAPADLSNLTTRQILERQFAALED